MTAKRSTTTLDEIVAALRHCRGGHDSTPEAALFSIWHSLGPAKQAEYLDRLRRAVTTTTRPPTAL